MLDLPNPDDNGARRVSSAIAWLHRNQFISAESRRGTPGPISLLNQDGLGGPYVRASGRGGRYVGLPLGLWKHGWIVRLSGSSLALLIILLDMQSGRYGPQWVSPDRARKLYDFSPDTWTKAIKELRHLELVTVSRTARGFDGLFDYRRVRNAYEVNTQMLEGELSPGGRTRRRR
jgi:hypothetical protein